MTHKKLKELHQRLVYHRNKGDIAIVELTALELQGVLNLIDTKDKKIIQAEGLLYATLEHLPKGKLKRDILLLLDETEAAKKMKEKSK